MAAIDVGLAATDRTSDAGIENTYIIEANPANAAGTIDTIEVGLTAASTGFKAGLFYVISGNTLKCRSAVSIGSVSAGSKQTFSGLNLDVQSGDYLGFVENPNLSGRVEIDIGGTGRWYSTASEDHCIVDDEHTYTYDSTDGVYSVYATGLTPPVLVQAVWDFFTWG